MRTLDSAPGSGVFQHLAMPTNALEQILEDESVEYQTNQADLEKDKYTI